MHCVLRPWRVEDADDLAAILNDREILDNLRDGLPFPYTRRDAEAFITSLLAADPGRVYAFAVTAEGSVVGSISAVRRENIHFRTAELGFYIARSLGQGPGFRRSQSALCPCIPKHGHPAHLRRMLCRKRCLLPGTGKSRIPAGRGSAQQRGQTGPGAGYKTLCPGTGRRLNRRNQDV